MNGDGGPYRPEPAPGGEADPRDVFCNRTLNLHAIRAIGYDMDYTLVHYHVEAWERRVYETVQRKLVDLGWPVADLSFVPDLIVRGLIIDTELGNVVKANRFGYVKRAMHGTRELSWDELRRQYARTMVDLAEPRWVFLNTLFSISEACLYCQLVERFADGLPELAPTYEHLYRIVRTRVDEAHLEGQLKAEIQAAPETFIDIDPELPLTLLDQQRAGKKLLLITNSEWPYTRFAMSYALDRFLRKGQTWRDLFELVIVAARKPVFFTDARQPIFEVVDEAGLLRPWVGRLQPGHVYHGGSASLVEERLCLSGEEILYVGDHIWGDVHVSKSMLRWRTALVLRELEAEIAAQRAFAPDRRRLAALMQEKEALEAERDRARLRVQRRRGGYGPPDEAGGPAGAVEETMEPLRARITAIDEQIAPLAQAAGELCSARWGPLLRTGNDKSHLARQIERHADVYLSRASNLLHKTPFVYLRSPRGSLPHDPE